MRKAILMSIIIILICTVFLYSEDDRGVKVVVEGRGHNYKIGTQYLVVIGINEYQNWEPLLNPVKDAKEVRDILIKEYYIDEVYELYNADATKANILRLFYELQEKVALHDSVLIFYAGHGHLDKKSNTGFWIPVNAGTDPFEQENWLPNIQIQGLISNMASMHICVISDSCFSGDLLDRSRSAREIKIDNEYLEKAYSLVSREILTSGALETVPDVSEFAKLLKMSLKKNEKPYLDPLMLYTDIRLGVKKTQPLLGTLKDTGHQTGASFLIFRREKAKVFGTIKVITKSGGKLYIDDKFHSDITEDGTTIPDVEAGEHWVKLIYENDITETKKVEVEEEKTSSAEFTWAEKEITKIVGISDKLSVHLYAAYTLPLADSREFAAQSFIGANLFGEYRLFEFGIMSLTLMCGLDFVLHGEPETIDTVNQLSIFTPALGAGLNVKIIEGLNASVNVAGGLAISANKSELFDRTDTSTDLGLLAIINFRYNITDFLDIGIKSSYLMVFYKSETLNDIKAEIGAGYHF